ncbi:hypothetical protein HGI30_17455 [Paenibacillus albicereus]|uniref:Uncharacterized protein n=1 Tax=Paenibacillus albicereus TaxID=2726185 RepID=A0A6H2H0J2_9BACL|nr:hypothetical protein [Paenibacillus albicereus]QJC53180.1 hypothetical protein HGI30_17455 [Paenibacillus albicereus]
MNGRRPAARLLLARLLGSLLGAALLASAAGCWSRHELNGISIVVGMVVVAEMSYPDTVFVQDFLSKNWTAFASIFLLYVPLLLYVVLRFRGRGKKQPAPSS